MSIFLLVVTGLALPGFQQNPPVVPWLHQEHGLTEAQVGSLLVRELRCAACHTDLDVSRRPPLPGPDLNGVGARIAPNFLERYIADPAGTQPGTRMPALLDDLTPADRAEAARALTEYLISASRSTFDVDPPERVERAEQEQPESGARLYHSVGCVACHGPRDMTGAEPFVDSAPNDWIALDHVPHKYSPSSLAEFLFQPLHVRPAGRMPDMLLSRSEAHAISDYLLGPAQVEAAHWAARPELVARGRELFGALRCNACHALEGAPALDASPPLDASSQGRALDRTRGCLASEVSGAPRYGLASDQRAALRAALGGASDSPTEPDRDGGAAAVDEVAETLTAFNCIACHARGPNGGVAAAVDAYFQTTQPELGDEARIPPTLSLAGAKLQGDWVRKVLFDAARVRPYMLTRMPQFGETNLAHLPAALLVADADGLAPYPMVIPEEPAARTARVAGRELLGLTGLGCVSCHDFNGTPTPGFRGIDLITTPERLQPRWFVAFMIAPTRFRPGIVMPESWPGGVAVHQRLLDGDTDAQLRAIWYFLSQGRSAEDPAGIRPEPSQLHVEGSARVYRGRSAVAGFRGVAVGFPEGVHYAFDAGCGSLTAIWRGDFVSVRWDGQGAGDFRPLAKVIELPRDVAFARLDAASTPWPRRPVLEGTNPVNPDPRYPRQHGYTFRGYQLDAASIPTLLYACGATEIEDRTEVAERSGRQVLRRVLRLTSVAEDGPLYMRLLTGDFEARADRQFVTSELLVSLPPEGKVVNRPAMGEGPPELLLELALSPGTTTLVFDYEPLD